MQILYDVARLIALVSLWSAGMAAIPKIHSGPMQWAVYGVTVAIVLAFARTFLWPPPPQQ